MDTTYCKPGSVPTVRYRVMAIVFFVIAVAGLFLGYLSAIPNAFFQKFFSHTAAPIYGINEAFAYPVSLEGVQGAIMPGCLLGYCITVLKALFTGGLTFSGSPLLIIEELAGVAQVALIPVGVLVSLGLAIAANLTNGKACRGCAMVCGYVVLATYLWPSLTVLFFGAGTALHTLTLFGKFSFTVDPIIMGIALLCFVILAVVTICRRKVVGLIRVINLALAIAMAIALIYPGTITATNVDLVVNLHGNLHKFSISYYYLVLILLLFATIGISIFRLNAKKFYQFEAVLTGVVFVVVAAIFIEYITVNEKARWLMFTQNPVAANVLLVGALVAFLLSVENVYLVLHRRKQLKKQREAVLAAIDEEEKTEQPETPEEGAPAAYSQAPYQPYPAPYNAPAYPQPAPYYPQPMPQMMQMSMTPAGPVYPPMPPVIVQQAPATPPVVVLQLPGNGQQQPVQVSAMQQYPYPQQAYAPAYPQPMPAQPQPALQEPEPPASDFARRMMVLADEPAEQPEKPQQPAPMPQQQAAVQPVETSAARPQHVGPHDAFLDTLTQQEFTEFNSLFIEGTHGDLGLPKYAVGKDNKAFFAKVFAALGKFRPYASDGLLDKLLSQKA